MVNVIQLIQTPTQRQICRLTGQQGRYPVMIAQNSIVRRIKLCYIVALLLVASFIAEAAFPTPSDADEKLFPGLHGFQPANNLIVPSVVHQIYDYQNPNFFLYLSLICVQRYIRPERHILWVNDEGRYRKGHWQSWQNNANNQATKSWEFDLAELIRQNKIEVKFLTFPMHPPGNSTTYAPNKAHRSDFVRLEALTTIGGIYLDTDAFVINNLAELRQHNFTMSFDNIVNPDKSAPKRLNNGVMLAAPQSQFLHLWAKKYAQFNPESFDFDSSVVPYNLMTQYPDLIHLEMSRIAPMSFAFQTARIAEILTCGLYVPPVSSKDASGSRRGAIWAPTWDGKSHNYENTQPDEYAYTAMEKKYVLHLTMSQVRGICMMRKALGSPEDLNKLPSLLGRIFRIAMYGKDDFDYSVLYKSSVTEKNAAWKVCRDGMGMHSGPEKDVSTVDDGSTRQQYVNKR